MKRVYNQPQTDFVRNIFTNDVCDVTPFDPEHGSGGGGWDAPMRW